MDYREPIAGCRAGEGSRMDHVNVPHAVRPSADEVVAVTDAVCRAHLDIEYADLCRTVVGKLGRKRPSPLTRGDLSGRGRLRRRAAQLRVRSFPVAARDR